jgi:hypothetical protein
LPKEFQVARLVTPLDRHLEVLAGSGPATVVPIEDGLVNIVYVHSVSGHAPMHITQMKLK